MSENFSQLSNLSGSQLTANALLLSHSKSACMIVNRKVQTLDEFTIQQIRDFPNATGELSNLLRNIGLAAKRVNTEVNKAGLVDILGDTGSINVQFACLSRR